MIKICVSGSKGKMGSRIIALAEMETKLTVSGEFDVGMDPEPLIKQCDCLIEFTSPQATVEHLLLCVKHRKAMVIGTTGLPDSERERIKAASSMIPIVFSPNMSIGVNLLFKMVGEAARALGAEYNVRIEEAHHIHKKDAPSGTAKEAARIIKDARGNVDIPINSVREDEIVGDHTIAFEGPLDTITIRHSAKTRDIFAKGALEAAKFIVNKPPKVYTMREVLDI
ncbi:MAG: 4-hydroxy-tetrahydrodipicolinate reductase [Candidatus Omnitrophica bacterium]|nr:4-hydroxy-tetrahydrodipicolinate reductase [Candidatus Omnitrophota bacterium]